MLYAFKASSSKEVDVEAGQVVTVVKTLPSGWTVVAVGEAAAAATGVVPSSYIRRLSGTE